MQLNEMLALGPKNQTIIGDFTIIFNFLENSLYSHRHTPTVMIQTHFQEKVMFKHRALPF